jgi:carbon-monoxide dehydrogenase medium subunit
VKPARLLYDSPDTLDEVLDLLGRYGEDAKIIAGGQSLMPLLAFRLVRPEVLIDLRRVPGLDGIDPANGRTKFGSMVTHAAVESAPADVIPATIRSAVTSIGHVGIRNRGTVGGSLAHADPSAEWAAVALAYDGIVEACRSSEVRRIPADLFFRGLMATSLKPDEVIRTVELDIPSGRVGSAFVEFARRHGDFALAGVCVVLSGDGAGRISQARIAIIGACAVPMRARPAELLIEGRGLTDELTGDAAAAVIEGLDFRGDDIDEQRYRRRLTEELVRRALTEAGRQLAFEQDADG